MVPRTSLPVRRALSRPAALAVAALIAAPAADAQIRWRAAPPQPVADLGPAAAARSLAELARADAARHALVGFTATPDAQLRDALRDAGVELLDYVGDHAFVAALAPRLRQPAGRRALAAVGSLAFAAALPPDVKLHPALAAQAWPPWSIVGERPSAGPQPEPVVAVYALYHRDVAPAEAVAGALALGADVRAQLGTVNGLVLELPASQVAALAGNDAVRWVEPPLPPLSVVNDSNRAATQAEAVQAPPYDLDGSGVTVMVYDGGAALESHPDFGGRVTARDDSGVSNHATHVSGTIGGDGSASGGLYRGMAPGATIESYAFQSGDDIFLYANPGDIEADYWQAINQFGAVLANNSIGSNTETNGFPCEIQGDYGVTASVIDAVVGGALGDVIRTVWATGNERQGSGCDVEGFGDFYSTAPPACAKNHLTVGALNSNDDSVTSFTSYGPCDDGRMKPDVSAPGCQSDDDFGVTSTSSSGDYSTLCGTSMASPTVTGLSALLLEDYRAQFPERADFLPSTLKAMLAHGALDLGNVGPDYRTGYGLVQIEDTIDHMRGGGFFEGQVDHGGTVTLAVDVPPGSERFQATLAWDDAPGTPLVVPALVNDLDLVAIGPDGTHFPWTLDPEDPDAPAAQSGPNRRDNLEQVRVTNPMAGQWTVQVQGFDVPEGPQRFSLVAEPQLVRTSITLVGGPVALVAPGAPTPLSVLVSSVGEATVAGSPTLHYRTGGGAFQEVALTAAGDELHEGALPAVACGADLEYFLSAEGSISGVVTAPPAGAFVAAVGEPVFAFADDFEADLGWTVEDAGVTAGSWEIGVPVACFRGDPPADADGSGQCFLTENDAADCNSDVDDGTTTLTSPVMDAADPASVIAYDRWYSNTQGNASVSDVLTVEVSDDGGASWTVLETVGPGGPEVGGGWLRKSFAVADFVEPTDQFRIRFVVGDLADGSVVEASVDGVTLTSVVCEGGCPWDLDGDAMVGVSDFLDLLAQWGTDPGGPPDFDGSGAVDVNDFLELLANWGPCA